MFGENTFKEPAKRYFFGHEKPCWIKPKPSSFAFSSLTRRKEKSQELCFLSPLPWHHHFQCLLDTARHQRWVLVSQLLVIPALEGEEYASLVGGCLQKNGRFFPIVGTPWGHYTQSLLISRIAFLEASNCNRKCHWMHLEAVHAAYGSILSVFHSIRVRWRSIGYEKRIFDGNFRAANANATLPRGWHCKILLQWFRMFKKPPYLQTTCRLTCNNFISQDVCV